VKYEGLKICGYRGLERSLRDERGLWFVNEEEEEEKCEYMGARDRARPCQHSDFINNFFV
jgi:hypothetical protein